MVGKLLLMNHDQLLSGAIPMYSEGAFGPGKDIIGAKNLVRPQFLLYGDWRTVVASNDNGAR